MSLERSPPDLERIAAALNDDGCRRIVAALDEPMTADEVAEATDLPLSSTYRKLDRLADSALVAETNRFRSGRDDPSRYVATVDRVAISLGDDRSLSVGVDRSLGGTRPF